LEVMEHYDFINIYGHKMGKDATMRYLY
jgi:hypothetical protein